MATASKTETQYEVTLVLNQKEAEALRCVLQAVGGTPETTGRGFADRIDNALEETGVALGNHKISSTNCSVWFIS